MRDTRWGMVLAMETCGIDKRGAKLTSCGKPVGGRLVTFAWKRVTCEDCLANPCVLPTPRSTWVIENGQVL